MSGDERQQRYEELLNDEPMCECERIDVDYVDVTPCEYHNPRSRWRQKLAAVAPERE